MKNSCRFLSFPGTAQMPACRVRRDSPHFWKFRKLANRIRDHIPNIEAAELRVARAEGAATLHARAGLVFGATYTSTILRRVVESMEGGGRPSFFGGEIETAMGPARGTMVVPSFWEMVVLMREDFTNSGFCDMVVLEDEGVLVRTRKVPIAISVQRAAFSPKTGWHAVSCRALSL